MTSNRASPSGCFITHPTQLSVVTDLGIGRPSKHEHEYAFAESILEVSAFEEDMRRMNSWPPRSYRCSFCRRLFTSAQALGGHMNVHRRDRARCRLSSLKKLEAPFTSMPLNHTSYDLKSIFLCGDVIPSHKTHKEATISLACPNLHSLSSTKKFDTPTPPYCLFHDPISKHDILSPPTVCTTNIAASKETIFLSATKSSARSPLLGAIPLLEERCRCQFVFTNTKPTSKYFLQTICLKTPSSSSKLTHLFDCKGSHHEGRSLLLKDSLSSCNIVDLELRLGQKNGA